MNNMMLPAVYYVEVKNHETLNPIAIRPNFLSKQRLSWEDTSRGKVVSYQSVIFSGATKNEIENNRKIPSEIVLSLPDDQIFLKLLTKEIFDKFVKPEIADSGPGIEFKDYKEVQDYYLNTNFMNY